MAFVIDSSDWDFNNTNVNNVKTQLECILERLSVVTTRDEPFFIGNELQTQHVYSDMDLWSFLYSDEMLSIDNDIKNELAGYFNSARYYQDEDNIWPENFLEEEVKDSNGNNVCCDYAFVHFKNIVKEPHALLSMKKRNKIMLSSTQGTTEAIFVNTECEHKEFWRTYALNLLRDTPENLEFLSPHAYPNLYFHKDVWRGINLLSGGYRAVYKQLQKYLANFDDYGYWIFTQPPPAIHQSDEVEPLQGQSPTNDIIQRRFQGIGLDVSPEKPNVRENASCKRAREISIDDSVFYCEWHGKIELHKNRIHIHAPVDESEGKLIIAIFHEHLELP